MDRMNSETARVEHGKDSEPERENQSPTLASMLPITIVSTFTVDPVVPPLEFWMATLDIDTDITIAPYAQVMQELLSPESVLSRNQSGFRILILRLEDWLRARLTAESFEHNLEHIGRAANDLIAAMQVSGTRTSAPTFVLFCPPSPQLPIVYSHPLEEIQRKVVARLGKLANVHCWTGADLLRLYPVINSEDSYADRIGHIPYSSEYFAAIATLLARRIFALTKPRVKVIAVDCDNTLWAGICGEDGPAGIDLTPARRKLQQLLVDQHDAGVLVCLCSKNNEDDVKSVFQNRADMPLRAQHLVASRVNWNSKSSSLKSLALELNLALDNFVFLDDSPLECAEVRANCPSVLTLQLPETEEEITHFLDHVWVFDRIGVSEDAKRRTQQYRENRTRKAALHEAADVERFLLSLELEVDVSFMQPGQLIRVAELVQRTNQFNLMGRKYRSSEIDAIWNDGERRILVVHVKDRFGDYGLVGALFIQFEPASVEIDTFVLSCRVLGRGVEHRIVNELGRIARQKTLPNVVLRYRQTARNMPAWRFLETSLSAFMMPSDNDGQSGAEKIFTVPVEYARNLAATVAGEAEDEETSLPADSISTLQSTRIVEWHDSIHRLSRIPNVVREMHSSGLRAPLDGAEHLPPRNPTETAVAEIWADILGLEVVGVRTDFFRLGGNSLLAVQVVARIESLLGVELPLFEFFEGPTVEEVSEKLAKASRSGVPIQARDRTDHTPLSWEQRRLWFIAQLGGGSLAYHIPVAFRLRGKLDYCALQAALVALVSRHEVLRTVFLKVNGEPVQHILPPGPCSLRRLDLRAREVAECELEVQTQLRDEVSAPFDLSSGPLIRGRLLGLSENEHVLLITMHHIVSDGWSIGVLLRELGALYRACTSGRGDALPPLPIQYRDYALWQQQLPTRVRIQEQLAYWKEHLQGAPELLGLPTDRPRPPVQSYRGANIPVSLGSALSAKLKAVALQSNLTLAMILYTAWAILLSRLSGQEDIVVGIPVANRRRSELEGLIGLFVNTLAVRVRLADDLPLADLLQRVKRSMLDAYSHQEVPFDRVVEALQPIRSLSHSPIFQVMFVLQNAPRGELQLPELTLMDQEVPVQTAQSDLTLTLQESAGEISGTLNYASDLFDGTTISRWLRSFEAVLCAMVGEPQALVSSLPMMSADDRRQAIQLLNAQRAVYPQEKTIHVLFEDQVERTPGLVAVVYQGDSLTYAELNARANQLARYLRRKGVGPDQMVAICVERGLEMVVGLLGILKAGGAYVPLDPGYPAARLEHMLMDSAPRVILTQEKLREVLPSTQAEVVALDGRWSEIADESAENMDAKGLGIRPNHLAYLIYTSGSTGKPKGVMVEHRNVTRLFAATAPWFAFNEKDVWTLFHSVAFDFSVWELWGALLHGGRVVVVPYLTARSPGEFYRLLCEEGVTVLNQTPSAFTQLIDAQANSTDRWHSLRVVIFGGEALEFRVLRPWVQRNGIDVPRLVNMYGITETTVHVTYRPILAEEEIESEQRSLIGTPIPDLQIYLLDRHGQPVPIGVAGEMYVGGAGVARGYLNRDELTAERFIPDPFDADPEARIYKTGDLARCQADGTIEYLGRNDHQVKMRGFRIELGEIEKQIAQHPAVKDVVVIAREDVPGEKRLVAYVTAAELNDTGSILSADTLRTHTGASLPEYMVPSAFVIMRGLPLTSNGKLDRNALPMPEISAYASRRYAEPEGEVEELLAGIWKELLHISRVGREDNFYELGGHSLLATQVIARVQSSLSIEIPIRLLFQFPTLQQLAAQVEELRHTRLLDIIEDGGTDIEELLEAVVSLSESKVHELLGELKMGAKS